MLQGMSVELDRHWAAEDEVLSLQSELDQLTIRLKESEDTKRAVTVKLQDAKSQQEQTVEQMAKIKSDSNVSLLTLFFKFQ